MASQLVFLVSARPTKKKPTNKAISKTNEQLSMRNNYDWETKPLVSYYDDDCNRMMLIQGLVNLFMYFSISL